MRKVLVIGALLLGVFVLGCDDRTDAAPSQCTPEWMQMVQERLNALEQGVTDLSEWRYQTDGGTVCPCPSTP